MQEFTSIYFVGIGGIGMSAIARYFNQQGKKVAGYDKTPSELTKLLENEGIDINYEDKINLIDKEAQLVVYTPAIPTDHQQLNWYVRNGYKVVKRSDVLQWITEDLFAITIAGTHGKTTISTMTAHVLRETGYGTNAFLGGIAVNYDSNFWSSSNRVAVIEADEYDRSFLKLKPNIAVLSSISPDHLDIYGSQQKVEEAFIEYTTKIKKGGTLWYKYGIQRGKDLVGDSKKTYSLQNEQADVYAQNIIISQGGYTFNVIAKEWKLENVRLNIGGMHNVENAVVSIAIAKQLTIENELIKEAIANFKGIKRRFEYIVKTAEAIYIDDYAHHPEELESLIKSAKALFPKKRLVLVFQPHLYSRTKDFAEDFARTLDLADEVILLEIYPAREKPIEGIDASFLASKMGNPNHTVLSKEGLLKYVEVAPLDLLITAGAGDIGILVNQIREVIEKRLENKKIA